MMVIVVSKKKKKDYPWLVGVSIPLGRPFSDTNYSVLPSPNAMDFVGRLPNMLRTASSRSYCCCCQCTYGVRLQ